MLHVSEVINPTLAAPFPFLLFGPCRVLPLAVVSFVYSVDVGSQRSCPITAISHLCPRLPLYAQPPSN